MWSTAASSVGGLGRSLRVLVEKVESGRGDGGPLEIIVLRAVEVAEEVAEVAIGLRTGTRSRPWVGRLRLRIAAAADGASLGARDVGSGGGGEGGGEC